MFVPLCIHVVSASEATATLAVSDRNAVNYIPHSSVESAEKVHSHSQLEFPTNKAYQISPQNQKALHLPIWSKKARLWLVAFSVPSRLVYHQWRYHTGKKWMGNCRPVEVCLRHRWARPGKKACGGFGHSIEQRTPAKKHYGDSKTFFHNTLQFDFRFLITPKGGFAH